MKAKLTLEERLNDLGDPDLKAVFLISMAMKMSTPRMRKENLRFVLSSPKYKIKVL